MYEVSLCILSSSARLNAGRPSLMRKLSVLNNFMKTRKGRQQGCWVDNFAEDKPWSCIFRHHLKYHAMAENRDGTECQIYFRMPRIDPLWPTKAVSSLATVSFLPSVPTRIVQRFLGHLPIGGSNRRFLLVASRIPAG